MDTRVHLNYYPTFDATVQDYVNDDDSHEFVTVDLTFKRGAGTSNDTMVVYAQPDRYDEVAGQFEKVAREMRHRAAVRAAAEHAETETEPVAS